MLIALPSFFISPGGWIDVNHSRRLDLSYSIALNSGQGMHLWHPSSPGLTCTMFPYFTSACLMFAPQQPCNTVRMAWDLGPSPKDLHRPHHCPPCTVLPRQCSSAVKSFFPSLWDASADNPAIPVQADLAGSELHRRGQIHLCNVHDQVDAAGVAQVVHQVRHGIVHLEHLRRQGTENDSQSAWLPKHIGHVQHLTFEPAPVVHNA